MNLGFTGTLKGMSVNQTRRFKKFMSYLDGVDEFHHGDAIGADTEAKKMVPDYLDEYAKIWPHPATKGQELQRNREIVASIDLLIAAPKTDKEVLRSGTWATIRYARAKGIPIVMLPRRA